METKKLTCYDLMVMDYVYRPDCYDKVVEVRKDSILGSDPLRGLIPIAELQPIPLTSDICDQVNDGHVILLWDDKKYEETGETWYVLNICNIPDKTICINIQYLHQLQQCLRLLNINKEIVL